MRLQIITPEKIIFDEEIDELVVPTVKGEIAILPHHVNLLTQIAPGEMTIKQKQKSLHMAVAGGFLQIADDAVSILADFAVRSEEIEAKKALEAQQRAEEKIKNQKEHMSERDFELVQAEMRRAILQLKVARKRHKGAPIS